MERISRAEAKERGLLIDDSVYPPIAYHGSHINPDDSALTLTKSEQVMADVLTEALEAIDPAARPYLRSRVQHAIDMAFGNGQELEHPPIPLD